jgi:predicted nucleic acid-binding protein
MKKVFLDINVILDSVLIRDNYLSAAAILTASDNKVIDCYASFLTVANAAYTLKKGKTAKEMRNLLKDAFDGITILPMDNDQLRQAYEVEAPDFEDVLQYECAKAAKCDMIITSNTKHFKFIDDIDVMSTIDFAESFKSKKVEGNQQEWS